MALSSHFLECYYLYALFRKSAHKQACEPEGPHQQQKKRTWYLHKTWSPREKFYVEPIKNYFVSRKNYF
jgi:hypothetical protein